MKEECLCAKIFCNVISVFQEENLYRLISGVYDPIFPNARALVQVEFDKSIMAAGRRRENFHHQVSDGQIAVLEGGVAQAEAEGEQNGSICCLKVTGAHVQPLPVLGDALLGGEVGAEETSSYLMG